MDKPVKKTSRVAIASLTVSIVAIAFLFLPYMSLYFKVTVSFYSSIAAIVMSIIAFATIAFRRKKVKGQGCAFAAITIPLLYIFVGMVPVARFMDYRGKYNLRVLDRTIKEYAKDHNGYLPVANHWCDLLLEQNKSLSRNNFKHPRARGGACNFAFNKNLSNRRLADVHPNVVLIFEADGEWNLTGTTELLKEREIDTYVLLVDGDFYRYDFEEKGIKGTTTWNEGVIERYIEPLRWE